jgi:micrococcal nuclease
MKRKMILSTLMAVLSLLPAGRVFAQDDAAWKSHSYPVLKVSDGDTITVTDGNLRLKVRLAGMDAPESGQPFGKVAGAELRTRLLNHNVQIHPVGSGIDPYNRVLGQVFIDGSDVSLALIREGFAYYYRPRCVDYPENKKDYDYDPTQYVEAEKMARAQKLGLWSVGNQELPCVYRKAHKR